MKNFIKNNLLGFVIGIIITSSVVGALAYSYQASDISYTTSNNSSVENVEQAINDLYGKLPYYVEYYTSDGQTYLGKTAHKYGESSILLNITPANYTGWSTATGGNCQTYSKGSTVTNLVNPGESIKLYAANEGFTGYVVSSSRNFEAHYTNGTMDQCYWTGDTSGKNQGTKLNGTGTKCNVLTLCTSTYYYGLNDGCTNLLPGTRYVGSGLPSTKTCS